MANSDLTDDDIFKMYANQADREYLHTATIEQLAADIRKAESGLSQNLALQFAHAIKRVIGDEQ